MNINRNYSRAPVIVLSMLLLASLVFGGVYFAKAHDKPAVQPKRPSVVAQSIDVNNFQATFLPNGQVYFGHLTIMDNDNYKLTDVYYLGADGKTLTKLGSEQHKPQDAMYIPRANISFWENLQSTAFDGELR